MKLIIISGRSGTGKTVALHALEDLGFYCVDNLPMELLASLEVAIGNAHPKVAVSLDARNLPIDLSEIKSVLTRLRQVEHGCDILYLDADDNILLRRFSDTRRRHPLTDQEVTLREAVIKERELLTPIANIADVTLDTSSLSQHQLHELIRSRMGQNDKSQLQLLLQSFGYKYGLPPDADFVFDLRCLPNPYWDLGLRGLTGLDQAVQHFFKEQPKVLQMLSDIIEFIQNWLPQFQADNRSYVTIALGCTGGQHRSVYLVEQLAEKVKELLPLVSIRHREL